MWKYKYKNWHGWFWFLGAAIVIILIWIGMATMARAQDDAIPIIDPDDDWMTMLVKLLVLITNLVLIPALVQWFRSRGYAIEQKHTEHLNLTVKNAAALVLDPSLTWDEKRAQGLEYIRKGAADAINYFGRDDEHLVKMLQSYINQMTMGQSPNID
jgi:hypothetical protein